MSEFSRNKRKLIGLMGKLESFTENELVKEMKALNKGRMICISPTQSIKEYLNFLVDVGVLKQSAGRYSFI